MVRRRISEESRSEYRISQRIPPSLQREFFEAAERAGVTKAEAVRYSLKKFIEEVRNQKPSAA